ncbi:GntP family permease [Ferrimonas lipolytica]|uniref:GntP family permease n=1 Tax=Ferrimonas lipolytica TaxID=2724191 RepID=A0A6H1UH47_9GAMM|nr:SLC13 family permease [Ferrimonas lipolytica]QIZ77643.1 GntP family permease [Ferrimonas lipolytica]
METTIIGIVAGLIALLAMVLKTRIHIFPAMIITALIIGLFGGMDPNALTKALTSGFGGTLSSIGLIIGFGVMMGSCFEVSGAAKRMARTFIKIFGKGREDIALGFTGVLVSIPVFCDSAYVLLQSLVRAISANTGKSVVGLGSTLAIGLLITHAMVPPTPGPVGVAALLGVDLGAYMVWGLIVAIPMMLGTIFYTRRMGQKYYRVPGKDGEWISEPAMFRGVKEMSSEEEAKLPSNLLSFAPILMPIALILTRTLMGKLPEGEEASFLYNLIQLVGHPVIAVGLGLLVALYGLTRHIPREQIITSMESGVSSTGIILLVTGAGGAMGAVLRASGAGDTIADAIASTGLPPILIPLAIASLLRLAQGSATVAMITAATITAPMVPGLGLEPVFVALACAVGAIGFSHFNDSYFHVVNRTLGVDETKAQMEIWCVTAMIAWAIGATMVTALNLAFGSAGTIFDLVIPMLTLAGLLVWISKQDTEELPATETA